MADLIAHVLDPVADRSKVRRHGHHPVEIRLQARLLRIGQDVRRPEPLYQVPPLQVGHGAVRMGDEGPHNQGEQRRRVMGAHLLQTGNAGRERKEHDRLAQLRAAQGKPGVRRNADRQAGQRVGRPRQLPFADLFRRSALQPLDQFRGRRQTACRHPLLRPLLQFIELGTGEQPVQFLRQQGMGFDSAAAFRVAFEIMDEFEQVRDRLLAVLSCLACSWSVRRVGISGGIGTGVGGEVLRYALLLHDRFVAGMPRDCRTLPPAHPFP